MTRMARRWALGSRQVRPGGLPGGELGTTDAGPLLGGCGRANRAVCPVAAGLKSIYRPSTIREQDHNM
jgi:hypothetical protein